MKKIIIAIAILILVVVISFLLWPKLFNAHQPIACTAEAKLCPDGSAVGRTGPNCEFAECPNNDGNGDCVCPSGYVKEGDACNPSCYYKNPPCLMPSIACKKQSGDIPDHCWVGARAGMEYCSPSREGPHHRHPASSPVALCELLPFSHTGQRLGPRGGTDVRVSSFRGTGDFEWSRVGGSEGARGGTCVATRRQQFCGRQHLRAGESAQPTTGAGDQPGGHMRSLVIQCVLVLWFDPP